MLKRLKLSEGKEIRDIEENIHYEISYGVETGGRGIKSRIHMRKNVVSGYEISTYDSGLPNCGNAGQE